MDIRVLQYFLTVAREETISGAAEVLHMTQPPLSRQLKELENELGKQLFIRGKRIKLTKDGMLLRKRAEEIVSLMEKTRAEVSASGEAVSGDGYDVTERLDRGLIDFGTIIEPIDVSRYDSLRLPRPDVWGLLMKKDAPLAEKEAVRPEDLRGIPLISSRQLAGENGLSGWLGYSCDKLRIAATGNLVNTLCLLAEEGAGYVFTLDGVVDFTSHSRLCFRPLEPRMESWMYLIWKKYQVFSAASELFLSSLKKMLSAESGAHQPPAQNSLNLI